LNTPCSTSAPAIPRIKVRPAIEQTDRFLAAVAWNDIASHRDGFRASDRYKNWLDLLHCFYDPMPTITYFTETIL
jgi:hypothetical protein